MISLHFQPGLAGHSGQGREPGAMSVVWFRAGEPSRWAAWRPAAPDPLDRIGARRFPSNPVPNSWASLASLGPSGERGVKSYTEDSRRSLPQILGILGIFGIFGVTWGMKSISFHVQVQVSYSSYCRRFPVFLRRCPRFFCQERGRISAWQPPKPTTTKPAAVE